jgi:hypothetical protein
MPHPDPSIARHFADLPDPRVERTGKHPLGDILVIALCATIAGADSWEEVERFGLARQDWLRTFLGLPNGIPSHDTFYRVFARLDPGRFASLYPTSLGSSPFRRKRSRNPPVNPASLERKRSLGHGGFQTQAAIFKNFMTCG